MMYGFNAGEVFKIALDIEENGRLFYEKAKGKTADPAVKQIFADLALAEVEHKKRFQALLDQLPESTTGQTVWDPDNEIDQYLKMMANMHVFSSCEKVDACLINAGDAAEALKLAMQFEKDSIVLFAELQSLAETDESRKQIGQLVKEEQGHLRKLAQAFRALGR